MQYLNKKLKPIVFILVLITVTIFYNQNYQDLNHFLSRGTVLEYSIDRTSEPDIKTISKKLEDMNLKYYSIAEDNIDFARYDFENEKIEKTLSITLYVLPRKNKTQMLDNVSDIVFNNCENSKLIDVKSLKNKYDYPWLGFLKIVSVLFTTTVLWVFALYFIFGIKETNEFFKLALKNKRQDVEQIKQNTKDEGIKYLLKKIFLEDEGKNGVGKEIVSTIVFVIIAVILIRYFIGELRWIPSGSMLPVIQIKDRVCVEKLDYPIKKEIKRGDILVFYPPSTQLSNDPISAFTRLSGIFNKDIAYIKRTIGLPGEKFEIKYNEDSKEYRVYINDVPLMEPYIISKNIWTQCNENLFCGPFIIPENSYFMMGDNRNNSQDSRFWGVLKRDRIIGRATFMFWPLDRINLLKDNYIKLHKNKYETYTYIVNRYEFLL